MVDGEGGERSGGGVARASDATHSTTASWIDPSGFWMWLINYLHSDQRMGNIATRTRMRDD